MGMWGKILGGVAGMALGGPFGAMIGAALGHAAESGGMGWSGAPAGPSFGPSAAPGRPQAMFGGRDQVFAVSVVVLSAKLAKCDGPVNRAEIDAFKRAFRIPPEAARDIGRLFDQARESDDRFDSYAAELGAAFADTPGLLEDVLTALFAIARADRPLTQSETSFLQTVCVRFRLGQAAWDRARGAEPRMASPAEPVADSYAVLGVTRAASDAELRAAWVRLMRENHPDSLASRGVPAAFIAQASDKVARINAAWDRIKRERGL
jgi:DnaJ like chaperone protein